MYKTGQRVLLRDGRETGILVGRVKFGAHGGVENVSNAHLSAASTSEDLWNVVLDAYFRTSNEGPKSLFIQARERDLHVIPPTYTPNLNMDYNIPSCVICKVQLSYETVKSSFELIDEVCEAFELMEQKQIVTSSDENNFNASIKSENMFKKETKIYPHPKFRFPLCKGCHSRISEYGKINANACCFCLSTDSTKASYCTTCKRFLCLNCSIRTDIKLYSEVDKSCTACCYRLKSEVDPWNKKLNEYREHEEESILQRHANLPSEFKNIFNERRDVIKELECGEKVFPTGSLKNTKSSNLKFLKKAMKSKNLLIDSDAFKSDHYYSKKCLTLLEEDVFEGVSDLKADLYIENYFQEIITAVADQNNDLTVKYYSEHEEKNAYFQPTSKNDYTSLPTNRKNDVLKKISRAQLVPKNFNFSSFFQSVLPENHLCYIVLEGRNGEYYVAIDQLISANQYLFELVGIFRVTQSKKLTVNKQFWLDPLETILIDFNTKANISHFLTYTNNRDLANIEIDVFMKENEEAGTEVRIFARTIKEIPILAKLVVFIAYNS